MNSLVRAIVLVLLVAVITPLQVMAAAPPQPDEFLGYPLGSRFTPAHRINEYFEALAAASPLVTFERYGETYEGRPLHVAIITSTANRARLDRIRSNAAKVRDPRITSAENAASIAATDPVIVWLGFGVHGDEPSSSEAAMLLARELVSGSEEVLGLLDRCVILIDPQQNPDGRDSYVSWFGQVAGSRTTEIATAVEHEGPPRRGRGNHYLIDLNRDWCWATQQETRARLALLERWKPQVVIDFHEMSNLRVDYFFPPSAEPINPHISPATRDWLNAFGKVNAEEFTARGWPFFVGETYDLFYPGYADVWATLRGSIGMTFEVAGGRRAGLAVRRVDGTILTLAGRIERHYTSALSSLRLAAEKKSELIRHSYESAQEAFDRYSETFVLLPSPQLGAAVDLLQRQGIEVSMLSAGAELAGRSGNRTAPAGSAVISLDQPLGRLAATLLEPSTPLPADFIEQQREKVSADENDDFYDLTIWSVPMAFDIDVVVTREESLRLEPWPAAAASPDPIRVARVGYAVDAADPSYYRSAAELLTRNVRFHVTRSELAVGDQKLPRGSLIVQRRSNPSDIEATLRSVAKATGARIIPVEALWSSGLALGSSRVRTVMDPRIALVIGTASDLQSAGALWFALDRELGIPHAVISPAAAASAPLHDFRVLIFPDGDYDEVISLRGRHRLREWVKDGGTLIAIKNGARFLRLSGETLSSVVEKDPNEHSDDDTPSPSSQLRVPGAAVATEMNERSFLTFGVPRPPVALITGTVMRLEPKRKSQTVLSVKAKNAFAGGFAWPESLEKLAATPLVIDERLGAGHVITFVDEPYYRLLWRSTLPLLVNAAIFSPTFSAD